MTVSERRSTTEHLGYPEGELQALLRIQPRVAGGLVVFGTCENTARQGGTSMHWRLYRVTRFGVVQLPLWWDRLLRAVVADQCGSTDVAKALLPWSVERRVLGDALNLEPGLVVVGRLANDAGHPHCERSNAIAPVRLVMETLQRAVTAAGIDHASVVVIGAVQESKVSVMRKSDYADDLIREYAQPLELSGTGEVTDGKLHLHVTLYGEDVVVGGHLHCATVRDFFVHAYVTEVSTA